MSTENPLTVPTIVSVRAEMYGIDFNMPTNTWNAWGLVSTALMKVSHFLRLFRPWVLYLVPHILRYNVLRIQSPWQILKILNGAHPVKNSVKTQAVVAHPTPHIGPTNVPVPLKLQCETAIFVMCNMPKLHQSGLGGHALNTDRSHLWLLV